MMPISAGEMPAAISRRTCSITAFASPSFHCVGFEAYHDMGWVEAAEQRSAAAVAGRRCAPTESPATITHQRPSILWALHAAATLLSCPSPLVHSTAARRTSPTMSCNEPSRRAEAHKLALATHLAVPLLLRLLLHVAAGGVDQQQHWELGSRVARPRHPCHRVLRHRGVGRQAPTIQLLWW